LIKTILWISAVVAIVLVAIVTWLWNTYPTTDIDERRLYFDAYQAIGIGFLVALLGTIIPNLILESRDKFERAKESRIAYSQAKTSVLYLQGTLSVLGYGEAMAVLQESHRKLHIAETYGKELKQYLKWYGDKETWIAQTYWELTAVRRLLQSRADEWKDLSFGARTALVDKALSAVRDLFGAKGERWKKLSKAERETRVFQAIETVCNITARA
jgi:hypothetical protein